MEIAVVMKLDELGVDNGVWRTEVRAGCVARVTMNRAGEAWYGTLNRVSRAQACYANGHCSRFLLFPNNHTI
jgi:hypothetical protein